MLREPSNQLTLISDSKYHINNVQILKTENSMLGGQFTIWINLRLQKKKKGKKKEKENAVSDRLLVSFAGFEGHL